MKCKNCNGKGTIKVIKKNLKKRKKFKESVCCPACDGTRLEGVDHIGNKKED